MSWQRTVTAHPSRSFGLPGGDQAGEGGLAEEDVRHAARRLISLLSRSGGLVD